MTDIQQALAQFRRTHSFIGKSTISETPCDDGVGRFQDYEGGASIYSHPKHGTHLIYGAIRKKWNALGREKSIHGYPITSELDAASGRGRFNNFTNGTIIWRKGTGEAFSVHGSIYHKWLALEADRGPLKFPTTDEGDAQSGRGRFNNFEEGTVIWRSSINKAFAVWGAIYQKWGKTGFDKGLLGYPITDEIPGDTKDVRLNEFEGGAIYWSATLGAQIVRSPILEHWRFLGGERSSRGLPIDDTEAVPNNIMTQRFEYGKPLSILVVLEQAIAGTSQKELQAGSRSMHLSKLENNRSSVLPVMSLDRATTFDVAYVIFRNSYTRSLTDPEVKNLRDSIAASIDMVKRFTNGLVQIRPTIIEVQNSLQKSDFSDYKGPDGEKVPGGGADGNPATFQAQFEAYGKVNQAIQGHSSKHTFHIISVLIPFVKSVTDKPSGAAWYNPTPRLPGSDAFTTIHYVVPGEWTNRGPEQHWFAIFVHEHMHCFHDMLVKSKAHPVPPHPHGDWDKRYPRWKNSQGLNPTPLNMGEPGEYLLYPMYLRPKEGWRKIDAKWQSGEVLTSGGMLTYGIPQEDVLVERWSHIR